LTTLSKGRVERAIRYVRDSFWAGRSFTTLAECNRQALAWRDQVAHQRRWPGEDSRTVEQVFAEEQPRLLPPPLHSFNTDRIETVRSHKTIYVRFDLNDYSIPPEAVGRLLTLVASDTLVRILDGTVEIARHQRTYDRHQLVLDPAHKDAVLRRKRKAFHAMPAGRLEQAVPESQMLLDLAFTQGESAGRPADGATAQTAGPVWPGGLAPRHPGSAGAQYAPRLRGRIPASP
jgi:hypothetical protein